MSLVSKVKALRGRAIRKVFYTNNRTKPLQASVLFESFGGKQVGDSPLELALELQKTHPELKLFWTTTPGKNQAPKGMTGLKQGSPQWLKVLATSTYLVNNANFPSYFRKRQGQIYLQTWHGTPLKMIGNDIKNDRTSKTYQQTMSREAGYWDYLISPSEFCSNIFPKAFATKAKLVELGYPRNDRLSQINDESRTSIRTKLGVTDPNLKLVLYAPTWRDTSRGKSGGWESVNYLNENSQLPEGFKLLYRGHSNTHASHESKSVNETIDVTFYPSIADLFIAADVLITDYSSVMFDFSVTGKPMIFLTPDISDYETDRGFYFNFREQAPGPICLNSEDAMKALSNLDSDRKKFAKKYEQWNKQFNPMDDGKATERTVKTVFQK